MVVRQHPDRGSGGTGRLAIASGKAGRYVGIELSPEAAAKAAEDFSEVLVGDVEQLDLELWRDSFDALIVSEVLEHLDDLRSNVVQYLKDM